MMKGVNKLVRVDWLSFLFPRYCEFCSRGDLSSGYICTECLSLWKRIEAPFCACCGKPFGEHWSAHALCRDCRQQKRAIDWGRSVWVNEGQARSLMHRFKFQRELYWRDTFTDGLYDMITQLHDVSVDRSWVLIPVPSDFWSFRKRGFNQSLVLARLLARRLGCQLSQPLKRLSSRHHQKNLSRQSRWRHARSIYGVKWWWRRRHHLQGRSVVLVDDISTTGATLEACASVLKKKLGVKEVLAVSVLRGISTT